MTDFNAIAKQTQQELALRYSPFIFTKLSNAKSFQERQDLTWGTFQVGSFFLVPVCPRDFEKFIKAGFKSLSL